MSVADFEAAANCLEIVLTTSLLSFNLVLKAHSIGMDVILGLHHHKALACGAHVTMVSNMEIVLLEEWIWEPCLPIFLMWEIQVYDTHWILKQENYVVMIPSPGNGKPLDSMELAKYSPIRLLADL